jgi:hypothetical protein
MADARMRLKTERTLVGSDWFLHRRPAQDNKMSKSVDLIWQMEQEAAEYLAVKSGRWVSALGAE